MTQADSVPVDSTSVGPSPRRLREPSVLVTAVPGMRPGAPKWNTLVALFYLLVLLLVGGFLLSLL